MTQEEKDLVLRDLCARLPYGVKAQYYGSEEEMLIVDTIEAIYAQPSIEIIIGQYGLEIEDVKPYLRPMSSMTEEEKKEYNSLCDAIPTYHYEFGDIIEDIELCDNFASIDWLNKKMFDYRGLIPLGSALEAPEGMYNN